MRPNRFDFRDEERMDQKVMDATPTPLLRPMAAARPFPADGLGDLAPVVLAIHDVVQSPVAMCANSVLAAVTLAAQAHVDVALPFDETSVSPVSGYFATIGKSGERKSATDRHAIAPLKIRERELREIYLKEFGAWKNAVELWESERRKILSRGGSSVSKRVDLEALGPCPDEPVRPSVLLKEPTLEGVVKLYLTGQPSVGIFSAEGGQFVGGHAMSDDAKLRSAAALSELWDAGEATRTRAGDGHHTLVGRRLSMHLLFQPNVAEEFASDQMLRGQGLMSRFLLAYPDTLMGTRLRRSPKSQSIAVLHEYKRALLARLCAPPPLCEGRKRELEPRKLTMAAATVEIWFAFADEIERLLAPDKPLAQISGFAAKVPEIAARIAAVLAWWSDPNVKEIGPVHLENAKLLLEYYTQEQLRLCHNQSLPRHLSDAIALLDWLRRKWWSELRQRHVSVADICQNGPPSIRQAGQARLACAVLVENGWLHQMKDGVLIRGKMRKEAFLLDGGLVND